jgi:hypothetical protein
MKSCIKMSQPDDVINQLILDLMNDMLPLTEGLAEGLAEELFTDFVWDIENEDLTF